ncbi:MAG: response regulator [Calditrichaeota bacterium]|nr:MAG: response regulator [Calditrichota bacterium]
MEVHSRPGVGTTFVVLWPVREKASAKTAVPSIETPASHSRPARKTILYVEDEPHIRQLIAEGLRQAGYRVLVAGDGQEAIERFGEEAIDILFTDVLMPRMDGQELAQRLKAKNPELVILFASGYAPSVFLNDQKVQLLRKPFSVKDVLRKLERLS